jgi:hypothetical protein
MVPVSGFRLNGARSICANAWLNVDVLLVERVGPFAAIFATGELERVDNSIIVQDADFEISVGWRN